MKKTEQKNKTEFLLSGEIGVTIRAYEGTSSYYPYNPMYTWIKVDAEIERDTLKIKTWSDVEQWTYCLKRDEHDTLANWQGREQAARYVGEENIVKAEQMVKKNLVALKKKVKLAHQNPIWLLLKPMADEVIKHYASDFYHWEALTLLDVKPEKFIWIVRECGSWLVCRQHPNTLSIINHTLKNPEKGNEYYWHTGTKLEQIGDYDLVKYFGKLPKSDSE